LVQDWGPESIAAVRDMSSTCQSKLLVHPILKNMADTTGQQRGHSSSAKLEMDD